MSIADIIVLAVLLIFTVLGLYKGLVNTVVHIASFFLSGILTFSLLPMVKQAVGFDALTDSLGNTIEGFGINMMQKEVATLLISVIIVIVLFLIIRFLIMLFGKVLDTIANLPLIKYVNKLGGAVLGVLQGFLIVYLALGILFLLHHNSPSVLFKSDIQNSAYASRMYDDNILLNITGLNK